VNVTVPDRDRHVIEYVATRAKLAIQPVAESTRE